MEAWELVDWANGLAARVWGAEIPRDLVAELVKRVLGSNLAMCINWVERKGRRGEIVLWEDAKRGEIIMGWSWEKRWIGVWEALRGL